MIRSPAQVPQNSFQFDLRRTCTLPPHPSHCAHATRNPPKMARPTIALQKTKQLQRSLSAISATPLRSPNLALPATFLTPHIASTPTRPFHSTQATRAKPAPKAARKKRDREYENAHTQSWDRAGRPYYRVDQDGLSYIMGKPGHVESTVKDVSLLCPIMYTAGIRDGIIPKSISLKKFEEVLTALTRAWFEDIPNANAITSISSGKSCSTRVVQGEDRGDSKSSALGQQVKSSKC